MAIYFNGNIPRDPQAPQVNPAGPAPVSFADARPAETRPAPPIGEAQLKAAQDRLERYKEGKANYDARVIENEDWWKLRHWKNFRHNPRTFDNKMQSFNSHVVSAYLFNSIMNKHADAMDNFPEPSVLPRERSDEGAAKTLSSVLPVIMENCEFEQTYSSTWWDKLKNGCGIYGVFFNPKLYNGLGDVDIRRIDVLNFYWEPGVQNIQDSKDIFLLTLRDNDQLIAEHPELQGKLRESGLTQKQYHYDDHVDTSHKSIVVDWYYKVNHGAGDILHYAQWVDDVLLFASENDPAYEEGFYKHGKYPFVVDVLFEEKGTPAGFGYIDVMKSPQEYIDRLGGSIMDNALWAAKPRYFIKDTASINAEQFLDTTKQLVNVAGMNLNDDNIRPIETKELSGNTLSVLQFKVEELKETSGNRDFSQGTTSAGVTAGSAIAALQEAGGKGSRDMIKGAYRAYTAICQIVIELVRQFYDEPRAFRITGANGAPDYIEFNNSGMQSQVTKEFGMEFATKEPVFDIKVKAQKSNPYSRLSQNELALQFYQLGFFNPQLADQSLATIDMMDFEGKEKVRETIRNNGTMYEQLQQMTQTATQLATVLAQTTGETRPLQALQQQMGGGPAPAGGEVMQTGEQAPRTMADRAREQAADVASVR